MTLSDAFSNLPPHWHCEHCDELATTMDFFDPECVDPGAIRLVTTDFQTHGHGQRGTHWESQRGKNLMFSFVFRPRSIRAHEQFLLSEIVTLAVARALDTYAEGFAVKWPNDVYWGDRKICGMLLRHTLAGATISATLVGVGININQRQFSSDAPNPVSLIQILEREIPPGQVLCRFVQNFDRLYSLCLHGDRQALEREYHSRLYHSDGLHDYVDVASGKRFAAVIQSVSSNGRLHLLLPDGTFRIYAFKELRFVVP